MQNRWEEFKLLLSEETSAGGFTLWFSQLDGICTDTQLVLYPPTEYAGNRIIAKYGNILETIASRMFGHALAIEIKPISLYGALVTAENTKQDSSIQNTKKIIPTQEILPSVLSKTHTTISAENKDVPPTEYTQMTHLLADTFDTIQRPKKEVISMKGDIPSSCGMSIPATHYTEKKALRIEEPSQGYMNLLYTKREKVFQHSFDSFVVGSCNMLAHASSKALCDTSNSLASCLYLSSTPGLGKTHLMHALGLELTNVSNVRRTHIEYLSAEDLTTQFTMAMQQKQLTQFLGRLKSADVFLLEDVHFLQGKEKMQSQLLSIVKALQSKGSKIVFSSSFSLKEIRDIDPQLSSCFQDGYVANISAPDMDFRREVIKRKALYHNIFIPEPVTEVIAENICSDIRQIEGCLKTLILKARAMNEEISLTMALDVLSAYSTTEKSISFDDIVNHVCMTFGIGRERLSSKTRQKECVLARNVIFYLARLHTNMTLKEVAQFFNRQHSTVIKGVTNIEQELIRATPKAQQIISIVNMFDSSTLVNA